MGNASYLSIALLVVANLLIPLSILIFATGFFPYKPFLPGLAEYEILQYGAPPDAPFDKLIFMVVDALRSDFVFSEGSGFEYTQSLIRDGRAMPFTANARSPTVTMPRIKSITTGSIPSFVDLILNFDEGDTSSTLAAQDTWLAQFKATKEGKLLMFGDDTWLKLFPNTFDRQDGTTSFFVSDFTEVDQNVTRNIAPELRNTDWNLMVLHYLGLDHIGHKAGPRSANMLPKQHEMDDIVETIFEAIESNSHLGSTLLVICGDHGMNDAGNHGASSPGETSPALVFMSPKLAAISSGLPAPTRPSHEFDYYSLVEQSDLAPTIAALLGFPVSKNNLGAFIPDFLEFWPESKDKIQVLIRNGRQLSQIIAATFGSDLFSDSSEVNPCAMRATEMEELACDWRNINAQANELVINNRFDQEWLLSIMAWLRKAQELMSSMASNYDMSRLMLGLGLALTSLLASIAAVILRRPQNARDLVPVYFVAVSYGFMMFASSYVEEEQHFWYWASTLWLAYLGIQNVRRSKTLSALWWPAVALVAFRLARGWNQTGQKFAGEPDIVKTFLLPEPGRLWILVSLTYVLVSFRTLSTLEGLPYVVSTGFTSLLISTALSFKLAFTAEDAPELVVGFARVLHSMFQGQSLLFRARLVFGLIALSSGFAAYRCLTSSQRVSFTSSQFLHHLYTLLALTQSRATNIPLFLLLATVHHVLQSLRLTTAQITTSCILLQYSTFFAFGGSNAISSVDLSSAYNGISSFNVAAVGLLTLISNWAGPIYWTSATNLLLLERQREGKLGMGKTMPRCANVFRTHIAVLTAFAASSVGFIMAACTVLRTHLFIWTVFSPKYLYCMAWSLGQHLLINVGFGGLLFLLGAKQVP